MNALARHARLPILLLLLLAYPLGAQPPDRTAHGNPPPEVFESPDRDVWQRPAWVLDVIGLDSADVVADIGAGSGYFSRRIARRVPAGRVNAIDIDPEMLAYLDSSATKAGITNIETRLVEPTGPDLAPASVDLIFLSNTLHHIEDRPAHYEQYIRALRPGGRIVNIDFYKRDLPVGPQRLDHKLARDVVLREFADAGLVVVRDITDLPYQYMLVAAPLPPIPNAAVFSPRIVTSGEPTPAQLGKIADLGFRTVLNLQTEPEGSVEEGELVRKLGLEYVNIPIVSSRITDKQVELFSEILTDDDRYPMLVHCRSSNRVGGLILLHLVENGDTDVETAIEAARRAGLKPSLEGQLRQRLDR